jgi:hypothetical protein
MPQRLGRIDQIEQAALGGDLANLLDRLDRARHV